MRPVKGYTKNKKIKTAKKSIEHAKKNEALKDRVKFWEDRVTALSVKEEGRNKKK
ncbi:MAG: hypothetical protein NT038_09600 [Euryarchaeota archaeon]|jgi:hypothetical protein|nr:hypothetical protein [Euryarchaeota archaeon]